MTGSRRRPGTASAGAPHRRPTVRIVIAAAAAVAFAGGMLAAGGTAPERHDADGSGSALAYTANGDDAAGTSSSEIVAALYRPQQAIDRLPDGVAGLVDPVSSRLVQTGSAFGRGYDETVRFYVARGPSAEVLCLVGTIANDTLAMTCLPRSTVLTSRFTVTVGTADRSQSVLVDDGDVTLA